MAQNDLLKASQKLLAWYNAEETNPHSTELWKEAYSELKEAVENYGWVDIRDRLPYHNNPVLIIDITYNDYYGIGSYDRDEGWNVLGNLYWEPTHWAELIEPPKIS